MKGGDEGVEEMDGVEWQRSVGGQEVVVLMLIRSWSLVYGYSVEHYTLGLVRGLR